MVPATAFPVAGIFILASRNSADTVEGTNHNEAEGAAFTVVVDGDH